MIPLQLWWKDEIGTFLHVRYFKKYWNGDVSVHTRNNEQPISPPNLIKNAVFPIQIVFQSQTFGAGKGSPNGHRSLFGNTLKFDYFSENLGHCHMLLDLKKEVQKSDCFCCVIYEDES